jgi:uncharacterized repeat protein (TIGR03803 family)
VYELSPRTGGGYEEKILHNFDNNGTDGYEPYNGVTLDNAGNLYGTTRLGGPYDDGTVFELTPTEGGQWIESVLHDFAYTDGASPWSNLAIDASGNLYGTTLLGGEYAAGAVFELIRVNGGWVEATVHSFNPNEGDGFNPYAGLTLDAEGNLYGTTSGCQCSYSNDGVVFELKHTAGDGWTEKVLHSFKNDEVQGYNLYAGVALDSSGNLYGATEGGGTGTNCGGGCGTIFKLTPLPNGSWSQTTLHNFEDTNRDGAFPNGTLIVDAAGNLYGTTVSGGQYNGGTVFKLTLNNGVWDETVLHQFSGDGGQGSDGNYVNAGVIFDPSGNIYGTTLEGGAHGGGIVFEIKP